MFLGLLKIVRKCDVVRFVTVDGKGEGKQGEKSRYEKWRTKRAGSEV